MRLEAKCKFCGKALTLTIDDDYAALGDPYGLLRLAACNSCADYRVALRKVTEQIKFTCMMLLGGAVEKEALPAKREALEILVKRYMRVISDHRDCNMPDWDEGIIDDMMQKPGNYSLILAQIPKLFRQPSLV